MPGLLIKNMCLNKNALIAAEMVQAAHPDVRFTSGRRSLLDQSRAMANNTIIYGIDWLSKTYKNRQMVSCLMSYVSEHPEQLKDCVVLTNAFHDLLQEYFHRDFKKMPHVVGRAFDIGWPRDSNGAINREKGEGICKTIEELPPELGLELILRKEGSLDVIHVQFASASQEVI